MFKSPISLPSLIQMGGIFMATVSLLASLILLVKIPEGALFLLVVGCSWLRLAHVAANSYPQEVNEIETIPTQLTK